MRKLYEAWRGFWSVWSILFTVAVFMVIYGYSAGSLLEVGRMKEAASQSLLNETLERKHEIEAQHRRENDREAVGYIRGYRDGILACMDTERGR